jgi:hypothetical protein
LAVHTVLQAGTDYGLFSVKVTTHLTKGDPMAEVMKANLTRTRLLLLVVLLVAIAGIISISLYLGDTYALNGLTFRNVTPDQLANAMHGDEFYSDYRENTLFVRGTVALVTKADQAVTLEFATPGSFKALCQMQQSQPTIQAGDTITVVSEAFTAKRQASAVLLTGCVLAVNG